MRPENKKKKSLLAASLTGLMLLAASCRTTEVRRDIPELDFIDFPECDYFEVISEEEILISTNWFIALAGFKLDYEGLQKEYAKLKDKANGN